MSLSEIRLTMGNPGKHGKRTASLSPQIRTSSVPSSSYRPKFPPIYEEEVQQEYESPRQKPHYADTGPHTVSRRTTILTYLLLLWVMGLTFLVVFYWPHAIPTPSLIAGPVLEIRKEPSKWHIPFNLIPDNGTNGRIMTMDVAQLNFDMLLRYDVCCKKSHYYVCRTVSKNLGIEGYLTHDNKAVLHINHPDMVGAQCTLMWIEQRG
jgi:hypothetical protein